MIETLHVYWNHDGIGQLNSVDGEFQFQYSTEWLTSEKAAPISAQLPLQDHSFPDKSSRCFFANLLPEGNIRTMIARRLGISEDNDFAFLKALGGDCAGALSLWPDPLPDPRPAGYTPLSLVELDAMIEKMETSPLMVSGEDLRLSLAGAQQKIPLMLDGERLFIPHGSAASSHIFKPDTPAFPGSAINEGFCMALAKRVGMPVPESRLWSSPTHRALLIERYDRRRSEDGRWLRLHQEDLCQALGYPHSRKYEGDGGPAILQIIELLRNHSSRPLEDIEHFLRAVVFNACIGNMDAHAKNFSMLISRGAYRLAPFYDLLSTRVYGFLSPKLAMRIGGQIRPEWLTRPHWEKLAREAAVAPKAVFEIVQDVAAKLPAQGRDLRKVSSRARPKLKSWIK